MAALPDPFSPLAACICLLLVHIRGFDERHSGMNKPALSIAKDASEPLLVRLSAG